MNEVPFQLQSYVRRGGSWRERMEMATERFRVESMVCGYYVYKDVRMLLSFFAI